jgi:hypothetical protein
MMAANVSGEARLKSIRQAIFIFPGIGERRCPMDVSFLPTLEGA